MAKDLLVGSTGFVGGNLAAKHAFAAVCHSTDIAAQFGAKPDLCVYAGVPAAMFLANADPDADLAVMAAARENLRQIAPKQLVLISSIAVYADSREKDEQSPMTPDGLPAYGRNRLQLERWVREDYPNALIVRLPALYGIGLKKNFLFDLHTITPAMLKPEKYTELAQKSPLVRDGYTLADNGFYKLNGAVDAAALREFFAGNDFNALAFTDSRSPLPVLSPGPPVAGCADRAAKRPDHPQPDHPARYGGGGLHHSDRQSRLAERAAQAPV